MSKANPAPWPERSSRPSLVVMMNFDGSFVRVWPAAGSEDTRKLWADAESARPSTDADTRIAPSPSARIRRRAALGMAFTLRHAEVTILDGGWQCRRHGLGSNPHSLSGLAKGR